MTAPDGGPYRSEAVARSNANIGEPRAHTDGYLTLGLAATLVAALWLLPLPRTARLPALMRCPSPSAACDVSADLDGWRGPSLADVRSAVFSVEGGRTIAIGRLTHGAAPSRLEGRAQPDPRRGVGDLRGVLVLRLDAAPLLGLPGH